MKKITVEQCEQISISTILMWQKDYMFKLKPEWLRSEFNDILAQRLKNIGIASLIHNSPVRLDFTSSSPHFGGQRHWLLCSHCGKRVRKLYKPRLTDKFECRHCHNLTYTSSQTHNHRVSSLSRKLDIIYSEQGDIAFRQVLSGIMQTGRGVMLLNKVRLKRIGSFPSGRWIREQGEQRAYDKYVLPLLGS